MKTSSKRVSARTVVAVFLFAALIVSLVYAVYGVITAPDDSEQLSEGTIPKSSYVLMITQCILGLIVIFLPSILERRFLIRLPNYMYVLYFVFLYCSIVLGEVRQFYYLIPNWDLYLHALSGGMLGALGFTVVTLFNDSENVSLNLSPKFIGLFSFCFALSAGALWEIYEYLGDLLLHMNMQKFRTEAGVMFVGQEALRDTMEDLMIDAASALVIVLIGVATIKRDRLRAKVNRGEDGDGDAEDTSDSGTL